METPNGEAEVGEAVAVAIGGTAVCVEVLVAVGVGVRVAVGVEVLVAVGVEVLVAVGVGVLVAVGVGVLVGVGVGVLVAVGVGVFVGWRGSAGWGPSAAHIDPCVRSTKAAPSVERGLR